ncbi:FtsX-like permease family protein [Cytophagaceae bacterium ABcell3]|nr:FtsX-like permease family protein [Cytophagaceae bacterium ABcell3]
MNLYYFISKRIAGGGRKDFSSLVSRIAVVSITVGLALLILAFAILEGFQNNIQSKIFSFGAHLQVTKYDAGHAHDESPLTIFSDLYQYPDSVDGIEHIQVFSHKAGLMRTREDVMGVVVKGVGTDFNLSKFKQNMVEGRFIEFKDSVPSRDIIISRRLGNLMQLGVGDSVVVIFAEAGGQSARFRRLHVAGKYETGLEEFDEQVVLGDIALNQELNDWPKTKVGGYEIFIDDFDRLEEVADDVFEYMDFDMQIQKITDRYIQIFDWLTLLNRNVYIFLALILFIACFNMVSTLLIMIMERTNMIGLLKSMGADNKQIQKIFVYNGLIIVRKGLLWGNIIGITLCALQYYFQIIPLDVENYYMEFVPIEWNWGIIIGLNVLTFLIIALVLLIPATIISKIRPINAIRFN